MRTHAGDPGKPVIDVLESAYSDRVPKFNSSVNLNLGESRVSFGDETVNRLKRRSD